MPPPPNNEKKIAAHESGYHIKLCDLMLTKTFISFCFIESLTDSLTDSLTNKFQTLWRVEGREELLYTYVQLVERMNTFLHIRAQYTCRYISVIMVNKNKKLNSEHFV